MDANRVLSALLRDGASRRELFGFPGRFYAPDLLREEVGRHADSIAARSQMPRPDVEALLWRILGRIQAVPRSGYEPFLARAAAALGGRDPDDVAYLACALAVDADAIWSHDRDFDAQTLVPRIGGVGEPPRG